MKLLKIWKALRFKTNTVGVHAYVPDILPYKILERSTYFIQIICSNKILSTKSIKVELEEN